MGIRQFKPVTKGTRFRAVPDFTEITRTAPEKSLVEPLKKAAGRDNHGHISMRRRGGGHKRKYRVVDFKRNKHGVAALVREVEYDPNRTAVHNVELKIGKGGEMCRSAGMSAQVVAKEGDYVTLRMPSTEMRLVHGNCLATIGEVGNAEHELLSLGKAGAARWRGRRPRVRGEVMNPVDHPHGGRTRGGRNVVTPWGKKEGVKTRNTKKASQRLIVRGRKRGKATQ